MIEQHAVVRDCAGDVALVEVQRSTACAGCAGKSTCGTGSLADFFGRRTARVAVRNPIGASPGQAVVVGYDERAFLRAAVVMYLLPIAALALAAAAAAALGRTDAWAVAGAGFGLAIGLVCSRRLASRFGAHGVDDLTILRRADSARPTSTAPSVCGERSDNGA